jgi:hypothetical protein
MFFTAVGRFSSSRFFVNPVNNLPCRLRTDPGHVTEIEYDVPLLCAPETTHELVPIAKIAVGEFASNFDEYDGAVLIHTIDSVHGSLVVKAFVDST